MSAPSEGLSATKPVSAWNQPLDVQFKDLFKALGKAAVHGAVGKWDSGARDLVDAASAVGLKEQPRQLAWLLIFRSVAHAVDELVAERRDMLRPQNRDLEGLADEIDLSLEETEVTVDRRFFEHPRALALLDDFQQRLTEWLIRAGFHKAEAEDVAQRLPTYFVFAVHHEWRTGRELYLPIQQALDTPFTRAAERETRWREYSAWLQKQVDEPLFGKEAFSLRQIYIPLRGHFERSDVKPDSRRRGRSEEIPFEIDTVQRIVVDLNQELEDWLDAEDKSDAIRALSGGPGSGKSSLARMFAAKQAEREDLRVLFVPLHLLDVKGKLENAIADFAQRDLYLPEKPMDPKAPGERILLILDGLDELAMQGKLAKDAATDLVQEVKNVVLGWNQQELRLQVLLSGRILVVQALKGAFRQERQILHLLPYQLPDNTRMQFRDEDGLLATDQRQVWWKRYGQRTGHDYKGLPAELDHGELAEISAEPLLNYLLALSHSEGRIDFSGDVNLNLVYEDLVRSVFDRGWGDDQHPALKGVGEGDFFRVLEEIALAVWHGDGRSATVREIEKSCKSAGLAKFLEALEEQAEAGVTRLLTAFYFRRHGHRQGGDRTFEFTHKSFGEYLAARRILAAIKRIDEEITRKEEQGNRGWDEAQALEEWARVCGPTAMDEDGFRFVSREVALRLEESPDVRRWQKRFGNLFGYMLRAGMPMEKLSLGTYAEQARQARNAEEALLAACSACARATDEVTSLDLPTPTAFGEWFAQTKSQYPERRLVRKCLNRLDLRRQKFLFSDLAEADLVGANLGGADLRGANPTKAHLGGANLGGAKM